MTRDASILFSPFRLGDLQLNNWLVMAPLSRNRATKGTDAPNELNARYYRQRATAGLIISEATQISKQGQGYLWTPDKSRRKRMKHHKIKNTTNTKTT